MIILDSAYFQGELYLPNLIKRSSTVGVSSVLNHVNEDELDWFVEKYEIEFLNKILGKKLTGNFVKGLSEDLINQAWLDMKGSLTTETSNYKYSPIANYVYFFIKRSGRTRTSAKGEVVPSQTFANNVDDADKLTKVWNDMCYQVFYFRDNFLKANWNVYKEYSDRIPSYCDFEPINALDI